MVNHPRRSRAKVVAAATEHDHALAYGAFLTSVQDSFETAISNGQRLFTTTASTLYETYLNALPNEQQVHRCHACRRFIETFGGLATIADNGALAPAMWAAAPEFYQPASDALAKAVRRARVVGVFLHGHETWGTPVTETWTHLAVRSAPVFRHSLLTPGQAMAAKHEDYGTVARALAEFTPAMLEEALRLLEMDTVNRAEKFIGPVRFLRDLHAARANTKGLIRENILWRAIASAPAGYCHPRASVVGSLLEDIAAGMAFEDIRTSFNARVHGLRYQRPQAAPSAANIAQAEAVIEKMGIARSLERRFARIDEIEKIWEPRVLPEKAQTGGVFAHLTQKNGSDALFVNVPKITMTWAKFVASVLPTADAMEFFATGGNYLAMLTAEHADAPPILKWDNPVSVYVYHGGSHPQNWNLRSNTWVPVTAISLRPNLWGDRPAPHHGDGLTLVLQGAVDTREGPGNALFPETLRDELHAVRSTIEAYSKRAVIGGRAEASACGYGIGKGNIGIDLRVKTAGRSQDYRIDRWD